MNEQEQNIAIAESMGWTQVRPMDDYSQCGMSPCKRMGYTSNYTSDLNACHEFEDAMTDEQYETYAIMFCDEAENSDENTRLVLSAKPSSRCTKYLKTICKWEGVQS